MGEGSEFQQAIEKVWMVCNSVIEQENSRGADYLKRFETECKKYYHNFIEYVEKESLEKHFTIESPIVNILSKEMKDVVVRLSVKTTDADWFMEFLERYRYSSNPDYYLDFDWGLSSGETNLLSTFALLYCIFPMDYTDEKNGTYKIVNLWEDGLHTECDSVILMIDEADLTLHPEWQREYIASLMAFLVRVYPKDCCKNIQLMLSTHSPILLSDVPQQNIIYLKKTEENHKVKAYQTEEQFTFSQNIHNLYKEGFFLEKGTMGRFAYDKIQDSFRNVQKLKGKIEELQFDRDNRNFKEEYTIILKEIEKKKAFALLIAEPIIRRKLLMEIAELERKLIVKDETPDRYKHFDTDMEFMRTLSNEKLQELAKRLNQEIVRRGQSNQ